MAEFMVHLRVFVEVYELDIYCIGYVLGTLFTISPSASSLNLDHKYYA